MDALTDGASPMLAPIIGRGDRSESDQLYDNQRTDNRAIYTPFVGASGENSSFPHFSRCLHCRTSLQPIEARWGTGLCDSCYGACERHCQLCGDELALKQLHWMSGICNK